MSDSRSTDNRIYIGNLPTDVRVKDIEDLFYKYGKIRYIELKNKRGPPFAFIEFEDSLDAEDSIRGRDGYNFDGYKLRVELQKGSRGSMAKSFVPRGGPPTKRSDYRCIVSGLPPTGSWQDVKDHMRVAGNVCYADVFRDGTGVVEFIYYDDMKYAVKHLDDTKFRSHEGETSYINVKADYSKKRSLSRSHSRSRSRSSSAPRRNNRRRSMENERESPSYSPVKRSRSRSRSYDDRHKSSRRSKRSYSRSRSRSRSRSVKRRSRKSRRSRSYSPKRRYSRSCSRSRSRSVSNHKNGSAIEKEKSQSRSRSRSQKSRTRSPAMSPAKSPVRSRSRSRSRSPIESHDNKEQETNHETANSPIPDENNQDNDK